jgi:hypothetical protein
MYVAVVRKPFVYNKIPVPTTGGKEKQDSHVHPHLPSIYSMAPANSNPLGIRDCLEEIPDPLEHLVRTEQKTQT